ncbi:hypothetical protein HYW99_04415 [Candidatus Woesearchaeota archaeon]|nr:hypothetical protein [Candidatus Woesearchaeota archaeon]
MFRLIGNEMVNINKIKEYWNKSSIWKQGAFIALLFFIVAFIYGLVQIEKSSSDMKWIGIMISFFPLAFLFEWYAKLNISNWFSIIINLSLYYILGVMIALIIKKSGGVR